jgi:hypothetical protein
VPRPRIHPVGAAYITASADYPDAVCLHSVVGFVPMFVAWALMLRRVDFSPNAVFLLFDLTGTLAEAGFGGRSPRWWHFPLAVVLPFAFTIPVAAVIGLLHPVRLHFPPIAPGS